MSAMYPNLFRSKYPILHGKAWIKALEPDDLRVFIDIGLQATQHGRLGGLAHSKEHLSRIGRIGAIAANSIKAWNKAVKEETERELGIILDY